MRDFPFKFLLPPGVIPASVSAPFISKLELAAPKLERRVKAEKPRQESGPPKSLSKIYAEPREAGISQIDVTKEEKSKKEEDEEEGEELVGRLNKTKFEAEEDCPAAHVSEVEKEDDVNSYCSRYLNFLRQKKMRNADRADSGTESDEDHGDSDARLDGDCHREDHERKSLQMPVSASVVHDGESAALTRKVEQDHDRDLEIKNDDGEAAGQQDVVVLLEE